MLSPVLDRVAAGGILRLLISDIILFLSILLLSTAIVSKFGAFTARVSRAWL